MPYEACVGRLKPPVPRIGTVSEDVPIDADDRQRTIRIAERLRSSHGAFLDAVAAAGRVTASSWDGEATTDRSAVVDRFERVLSETGTLSVAPKVLASAVDAAGGSLQADPVPSPPYVAVTAEGLVLRASTDVGRVVVTVAPFAVEREPVRYVHRAVEDPGELVHVEIHE